MPKPEQSKDNISPDLEAMENTKEKDKQKITDEIEKVLGIGNREIKNYTNTPKGNVLEHLIKNINAELIDIKSNKKNALYFSWVKHNEYVPDFQRMYSNMVKISNYETQQGSLKDNHGLDPTKSADTAIKEVIKNNPKFAEIADVNISTNETPPQPIDIIAKQGTENQTDEAIITKISVDDIPDYTEKISINAIEKKLWSNRIWESIQNILPKKISAKKAVAAFMLLSLLAGSPDKNLRKNIPFDAKPKTFTSEQVKIIEKSNYNEKVAGLLQELTKIPEKPIFNENDIIKDDIFVKNESQLYSRDIVYYIDRLTKKIFTYHPNPSYDLLEKYKNTVGLLLSAKRDYPQAVKFNVRIKNEKCQIEPIDWQENIEVKKKFNSDVVIYGGELESVVTAVEAADKGLSVTLVYSGVLGGLSSDTGGNMRYFDAVSGLKVSSAQKKIMHDALKMEKDNEWSIPDNVSEKLSIYLQKHYKNKIHIIPTASYNSTHLNIANNKINNILLKEGVKISATRFIDVEPESILAEKAGIPMTIETPNLAYGMVFDVKNLSSQDLHQLTSSENLDPDKILKHFKINKNIIFSDQKLAKKYYTLKNNLNKPTKANKYVSYGYSAAAEAFDFYMNCLEIKSSNEERGKIHELNQARRSGGFNVASHKNSATFNSISYQFGSISKKAIRQNDHSLTKDKQFSNLREIEIPGLEQYLQFVCHNNNLVVRMPNQLYVRQAPAIFETKNNYNNSDFTAKYNPNILQMSYPNDVRGFELRDQFDQVSLVNFEQPLWNINPNTTQTNIDNLNIIGKSAVQGQYMGALRIIQNLMSTGVALVDQETPKIIEKRQNRKKLENKPEKTIYNLGLNFSEHAKKFGLRVLANGKLELNLPNTLAMVSGLAYKAEVKTVQ